MTDVDNNNAGPPEDKMEDQAVHSCPHCSRNFKKMYYLTRHIYREHIKPTCTACSNSFFRMKELKEHARDSHELKMNKLCSICKKAYSTRRDLEHHLEEEHVQEKPHICVKCPRIFTTEERLQNHMATHRKMGSFQCSDCSMTFTAPFRLARHKRNAHSETSKSLQCPECGEHFQADEELRKRFCQLHLGAEFKVEKPFPCKYCEQSFFKARDMNAHIRSEHADKRPVKCDQCSFIFETENDVKLHVARRHAMKKFGCDLCRRKFWREHVLQQHLTMFHGVKNDVEETVTENGEQQPHGIKEVTANGTVEVPEGQIEQAV